MDQRRVELYLRHIHEGGAKIAEFSNAHSEIRPEFIEDITAQQEAKLRIYGSELDKIQQIEREELAIELSHRSRLSYRRKLQRLRS